jgi:iron complex transport system ATP-binding protein
MTDTGGADPVRGLSVRGLTIGYRHGPVLARDLDLEAPPGELVAVIGPNGTGKSTLLRVIAGLQVPRAGRVMIDGIGLTELDSLARARRIAVALAQQEAPAHLRARELVALGRYPYTPWLGALSRGDHTRIDEALQATGIAALAEREVATMSDGEAQKAHIARGIAQEAPLLVLDEPTAYLDVTSRFEITHMLRDLAHRDGRLVIFSTHDLAIARETADRMWLFVPQAEAAVSAVPGSTGASSRVAEGAPEDLALSGAIREAFSRHGVTFDEDGSPVSSSRASETGLTVALSGADGPRLRWTRRALARAGARLADRLDVATVRVQVAEDRWRVELSGGHTEEARSILELVSRLRGIAAGR